MEQFCTECLRWTNWQDKVCLNCQTDFSSAWTCEKCHFLYRSTRMQGDLCEHCHQFRPMCFPNWYPSEPKNCYKTIESFPKKESCLSKKQGGLVPHAGWYFSGPVASLTYSALANGAQCVVLLGAVHRVRLRQPCVPLGGRWETPLGTLEVDTSFVVSLLRYLPLVLSQRVHETEHSLEVQLPFVKYYFPRATIVPIMVPPLPSVALELGNALSKVAREEKRSLLFVCSSDLTHYGPIYGHTQFGPLPEALPQVHAQDQKLLQLVEKMEAEKLIEEALRSESACGPGALAAGVLASRQLGGKRGEILQYATSFELRPRDSQDATVGYAAVVWGE